MSWERHNMSCLRDELFSTCPYAFFFIIIVRSATSTVTANKEFAFYDIYLNEVKTIFYTQYVQIRLQDCLKGKERDLTQSYDKSSYTHRKLQTAKLQHKNHRLHNDCTPA